jgi:hypothetical protein
MGARGHQFARDDGVTQARPSAVDVVQECLEGAHPLANARGQVVPFDRGDDARDEVEREGPFLTAEGEGDPSLGKGPA